MEKSCSHIEKLIQFVKDQQLMVRADTSCEIGLKITCKICRNPDFLYNYIQLKVGQLPD